MHVAFDIFLVLFLVVALYLVLIYMYNHSFITADKRIAIDYLPFPVYFGLGNRLPLVINDQMYELIYHLKGKPLTDVAKDFECINKYRLSMDESLANKYKDSFFIKYQDTVYCIDEKLFADGQEKLIQIQAQNITEEYNHLLELRKLNEAMRLQNERLQSYIRNSIEINREQELLDAKINIHGKFGDCIAMTRHVMKHPEDVELSKKVNGLWQQIIVGFSSSASGANLSQKGYEELTRISNLVGCKITVYGSLPDGEAKGLLIKFLREALNNAIRHANATELYIDMREYQNKGIMKVYDNGHSEKTYTKMGGGLSALTENLEKHGVTIQIRNEERFEITLSFPEGLRS